MSSGKTNETDTEGEIELANGEIATIPMPDAVCPTFARLPVTADVSIEDGRIRMREEMRCRLSLAGAHRDIDTPTPVATLYANLDSDDRSYSEIHFESTEDLRELRDALDLYLRYRGEA